MITKRQQLINEVVEDLVATRTGVNLMLRFNKIMKTEDVGLITACHAAMGIHLVDLIEEAQESEDPECALWEYLEANAYFEQKLEDVVYLSKKRSDTAK